MKLRICILITPYRRNDKLPHLWRTALICLKHIKAVTHMSPALPIQASVGGIDATLRGCRLCVD